MPRLARTRVPWEPARLPWADRLRLYVADPHFGHTNIIRYCARPFPSVAAMDIALLTALRAAEETGAQIILCGDVSFQLPRIVATYGWLADPARHVCIAGNHDAVKKHRETYEACFGLVVGTEKTWHSHSLLVEDRIDGQAVDVLCSHDPQPDLHGAPWNVHGHFHDNLIANPAGHDLEALEWLLDSAQHLNAGVELTGYAPVSLAALIAAQATTLRSRIPDLTASRAR